MKRAKEVAFNEMLKALSFAAKNLEEIAIPMAEKHGYVTSMNHALEQAKAAIKKAVGE